MLNRGIDRRQTAAIVKAVRRHVDDAHDARPIKRNSRKGRSGRRQSEKVIGDRAGHGPTLGYGPGLDLRNGGCNDFDVTTAIQKHLHRGEGQRPASQ